jgi:cell division protein FtsA
MQDIFELAAIELKNSQIFNELPAGVVVTGGGSLIKGTRELAEEILGLEVNLGLPRGLSGGLSKEVESPIYATGVGLILHRARTMDNEDKLPLGTKSKKATHKSEVSLKSLLIKVKTWFDEL